MAKKRHKHEEHEEHVNHERWLVTYADMITLLMVLFIVLFAMGQTDLAKYKKLRNSLAVGFGGPDKMALLDGGQGINEGGASPSGVVPSEIAANTALNTLEKRVSAWKIEKAKLEEAATALREAIRSAKSAHLIDDSQIKITVGSRGLIVSITSDVVLFAPGSATLQTGGQRILDRLASQLVALPNQITVEGHTDDEPISGTYPSNWELSTARASSVLRSFIERHGLPASRGTAAGYADQRPVASNDTAAGRTKNRRVEIVLVAAVTDPTIDSSDAVAAANAQAPEDTQSLGDSQAKEAPQTTEDTQSNEATQSSEDAQSSESTKSSGDTQANKSDLPAAEVRSSTKEPAATKAETKAKANAEQTVSAEDSVSIEQPTAEADPRSSTIKGTGQPSGTPSTTENLKFSAIDPVAPVTTTANRKSTAPESASSTSTGPKSTGPKSTAPATTENAPDKTASEPLDFSSPIKPFGG